MGHIFISYSHTDTEDAHVLAAQLQERGFEVWIDERLDHGSQWPHELQKQLDSCSAFIVIMRPLSYASEWVQSELQRARRKGKPLFPLLLVGEGAGSRWNPRSITMCAAAPGMTRRNGHDIQPRVGPGGIFLQRGVWFRLRHRWQPVGSRF